MRIGIFGDVHGELKELYRIAEREGVDAILQVGDFETIRDKKDLKFFPTLPKFRVVKDYAEFHRKGEVPIPTFFIGGNHEAFNVLEEYDEGGELIRNLYFIGRAGTIGLGGLTIGGLSGIYSDKFYKHERKKEFFLRDRAYFTESDLKRLEEQQLDILLTHEWPFRPIIIRESAEDQIRIQKETLEGQTGEKRLRIERERPNGGIEELVDKTRPRYLFCGHMHIHYEYIQGETQVICLSKLKGIGKNYHIIETEETELLDGEENK